MIPSFFLWHVYAFISGIAFYFITAYAYNEATYMGRPEGFWAGNFCLVFCQVLVHHVICCIGVTNWNWFMTLAFAVSFLLYMPITVMMNEGAPSAPNYMGQFSELMHSPTFWLTMTLVSSLLCLPFYLVRAVWNLLIFPQFNVDQNKKLQ
jgi:hypothetical protein